MCIECHNAYDNGNDEDRRNYIEQCTKEYLKGQYKDWKEENLIYRKWSDFKNER